MLKGKQYIELNECRTLGNEFVTLYSFEEAVSANIISGIYELVQNHFLVSEQDYKQKTLGNEKTEQTRKTHWEDARKNWHLSSIEKFYGRKNCRRQSIARHDPQCRASWMKIVTQNSSKL